MKNILSKILRWVAAPLTRWPGALLAMTLLLAAIPATVAIVMGEAMKTLLLAALCQGFVYAWLLTCVAAATRRRWVMVAVTALVALLMWLLCLPVIFTGRMMSPQVLLLMLETDAREAGSFLRTVLSPGATALAAAWLAGFAAIVWGGIRFNGPLRRLIFRRRWCAVAVGMAAVAAGGCGTARLVYLYSHFMTGDVQAFESWTILQSRLVPTLFNSDEAMIADGVTATLYTLHGLHVNTAELPRWEETQRRVIAEHIPHAAEADSVNVVVIIGESFIKHHSPLYGYPLETTPWMSAEAAAGRLVPFTDYISPANFTSAAMRNFMNLNSVGDGERWSTAAYFPLVAARAGWRVRLFDNQVTAPKYVVDVQISALIRNPLLNEHCYAMTNDTICRYDGDFLEMVQRLAPPDASVGNLDIYHIYGQHFHPADRYPAEAGWDYFTADSIPYTRPWLTPEKKQYIAEYDNATRYNDHIISRITDRYAATPTIFIYFSDHGEEMYDASDCAVRNEPSGDLAGWLRRQFEVPFFIIANDRYIALRPDIWSRVTAAARRPGMLDNVGQLILGLAGVDASDYRPDRDLLSPAYRCPPRRTATRSLLYDSIVGRVGPVGLVRPVGASHQSHQSYQSHPSHWSYPSHWSHPSRPSRGFASLRGV